MHKETFRFLSLLDHGGSLAIVNGNEAGSPHRKEQGWPGETGRQSGRPRSSEFIEESSMLAPSIGSTGGSFFVACFFIVLAPALFIILALRQLLVTGVIEVDSALCSLS